MNRTRNLAAALELASKGWKVFPCRHVTVGEYQAKSPMTKNRHLNATTDADQIRAWWGRWPYALIGAVVPDTMIVVDIDPRNGGSVEALGNLPPTLTAWSGRNDGGRHLYFMRPAGETTSTRLPSDGVAGS